MIEKKDLTKGSILPQIFSLALPIIGSSFIQMAYNMADIFWIGKAGSEYVTAIGSAGYILWFSVALIFMVKIGVEVGISQAIGRKEDEKIRNYSHDAIRLASYGGIVLMLFCLLAGKHILSIFNFDNPVILTSAENYLSIYSLAFPFFMSTFVFTGIFNALGDSKTPFYVNSIGLILNIIADPFLIMGIGPFPEMKAEGAAIASLLSQMLVFVIFLVLFFYKKRELLPKLFHFSFNDVAVVKHILTLGFPVSLQTTLFALFAFFTAQIISGWGAEPVAMISIGANIEAVSWMTASGFATALGTFTGQNFGAHKFSRIIRGYFITASISVGLGLIAAVFFYYFPVEIVSAFNNETAIVTIGTRYMKIIAISQMFMCLEISATGVFNGIGKTKPPAIVGIVFNALRVVGVFYVAQYTTIGVDGAWWSISLSSVLKGIVLVAWLLYIFKNMPDIKNNEPFAGPVFVRLIPNRIRQQIFDKRTK